MEAIRVKKGKGIGGISFLQFPVPSLFYSIHWGSDSDLITYVRQYLLNYYLKIQVLEFAALSSLPVQLFPTRSFS